MKILRGFSPPQRNLILALLATSLVSTGFFLIRVVGGGTWRYLFMLWNLLLAWFPLAFAYWLRQWLKSERWLNWRGLLLTALWLGFLPNSFYILSDFIHLRATGEVGLLYDVVVLTSFAFSGLVLGFISLYFVHIELLKRMRRQYAHILIAAVLLLCSFAIYLGRYLRWNTWDILVNPAGILFDVTDRFINPAAFPRTFSTTASFFVLLSTMYFLGWFFAAVLSAPRPTTAGHVRKTSVSRTRKARRKPTGKRAT